MVVNDKKRINKCTEIEIRNIYNQNLDKNWQFKKNQNFLIKIGQFTFQRDLCMADLEA